MRRVKVTKPLKTASISRLAYERGEIKKAERDPLVRAVLDQFPGAEVVSVQQPNADRDP